MQKQFLQHITTLHHFNAVVGNTEIIEKIKIPYKYKRQAFCMLDHKLC